MALRQLRHRLYLFLEWESQFLAENPSKRNFPANGFCQEDPSTVGNHGKWTAQRGMNGSKFDYDAMV